MSTPSDHSPDLEKLLAYSELLGLGYDRETLQELAPIVEAQLGKLAALWQVETGANEMSVTFSVLAAWGLRED